MRGEIRRRMPFAAYQQLPGTNISTLKHMGTSPLHFRHAKAAPPTDTYALRIGKAAHTAVLEPLQFMREYVLRPEHWPNWRTKAACDWRDQQAAEGRVVLTHEEYSRAEAMQTAVQSHPEASRLLRSGDREVTITWTDEGTSIDCKGRVDWLAPDLLLDLKTTRHPLPADFARDAARLSYFTRLAWYRWAVECVTGELLPVYIVAVQNEAPHDVVVYRVEDESLRIGRARFLRWLEQLHDCTKFDTWPGVSEEIETLAMPDWAKPKPEPAALTIGGEALPL